MKKPYNSNKETSSKSERAESARYESYERKQPGYSKSDRSDKGCSTGKGWKSFKGCK